MVTETGEGTDSPARERSRGGIPAGLRAATVAVIRLLWWSVFLATMAATIAAPFWIARALETDYRAYREFGIEWDNSNRSLSPVTQHAARAGYGKTAGF